MDRLQSDARRVTLALFAAQSLSSAALIAVSTLNAIVGAALGGGAAWAGVPSAVVLAGSAGAAPLWGRWMGRFQRRPILAAALLLGGLGAALSAWAVAVQALWPFLGGLLLTGFASAAMGLGRFVAAEVHPAATRGRAISLVVFGGTVGAIFGPLLVAPTGVWTLARGWGEMTGAYLAGGVLLAASAAVLFAGLRPDPSRLAAQIGEGAVGDLPASSPRKRRLFDVLTQPAAAVAVLAMSLGQVVMVMVMVITSLHMREHQHDLIDVSLVISSHTVGMFAFSIVSGKLADSLGRWPTILLGCAALLVACLIAPLSADTLPLGIALFLLGVGWNLTFVAGSTLLADQLRAEERWRIQGVNDLLVGLASAAASLGSGMVFAWRGYAFMVSIGASLTILLICVTGWWWLRLPRRLPSGAAGD